VSGPPRPSSRPVAAIVLAVAAFVAVAILMLMPMGPRSFGSSVAHLDKLVHAGAWATLAVCLWPLVRHLWRRPIMTRFGVIVAGLGLWGLATEWLQSYVPSRSSDLLDALADLAGAVVGATLASLFLEPRLARRTPPPAENPP
jgi:VanZ family protein